MKLLSLLNVNTVLASVGLVLFLWVVVDHNTNNVEAEQAQRNERLVMALNYKEDNPAFVASEQDTAVEVAPATTTAPTTTTTTTATTTTTTTATTTTRTTARTTTTKTTRSTTKRTTTLTTGRRIIARKGGPINIVMTATNSHGAMSPIMVALKDCLSSICSHTKETLVVHMIADPASKDDAGRVVKTTCAGAEVVLYDATEIVTKAKSLLGNMQEHFSAGGYYGQGIFFLEPAFHLVLPQSVDRIIVLDLDLHFTADIRRLHELFDLFGPEAVMGLAQEQQPVYRHMLHRYRDANKGTHLGNAGPGGFAGFNSGVLLMDLSRMRASALYARIFNTSMITDLTAKYSFKGHLGDQDMYTLIACEHPELFLSLPCAWNRQLCVWWRDHGYSDVFEQYWRCDMPIHVWHGNCKTPFPQSMPDT